MSDISIDQKKKQEATIGRDFTMWQLIRFALPAILTKVCTQVFKSVDDGLFVSRYVGESALAATKLIAPVLCLQLAFANLFSIGACMLSSQEMGKGHTREASRIFTRISCAAVIVGLFFSCMSWLFAEPICLFLGADDTILADAVSFFRIIMGNSPIHLAGVIFDSYYAAAGKPVMGLISSITNGVFNILFDVLFIVVLKKGVAGAAWATALGEIAILLIGLVFYSMPKHEIHFIRPKRHFFETTVRVWKAGFSQFINNISMSVTSFASNHTLLNYLGSDGLAANAIIVDLRVILNAAFVGYTVCVGPVIAYNFGNRNPKRLRKILGHNLKFWFFGTSLVTILGELSRSFLIKVFIPDAAASGIYDMTMQGLGIEFLAVMFTCGCVFIMRMFVALGAPKTASILTTLRNFVFRLAAILLLPRLLGVLGIWLIFPVAEFVSFLLGATLVFLNRDNYGYGRSGAAYLMQGEPVFEPDSFEEDEEF